MQCTPKEDDFQRHKLSVEDDGLPLREIYLHAYCLSGKTGVSLKAAPGRTRNALVANFEISTIFIFRGYDRQLPSLRNILGIYRKRFPIFLPERTRELTRSLHAFQENTYLRKSPSPKLLPNKIMPRTWMPSPIFPIICIYIEVIWSDEAAVKDAHGQYCTVGFLPAVL
jgi:hypothetical protein